MISALFFLIIESSLSLSGPVSLSNSWTKVYSIGVGSGVKKPMNRSALTGSAQKPRD